MPSRIASLCVFCGSRVGDAPVFREQAARLARLMAEREVRLVYGGGTIGLMGVLADAALAAGGEVVGVIPDFLDRIEVGHRRIQELVVVDSMHVRKQRMFDLADGFVVLPGGIGTLDEMIEVLTWRQLRRHDKPVVLVSPGGYWRPFLDLVDRIVARGFAAPATRRLYRVVEDVDAVFEALADEGGGGRGTSAGL